MTPTTRLNIVDVEVLVDGTWWPGNLEHWRRRDDRWEGWIRWSTGPGENRVDWFPAERIRRV
jgi:hypothetical protein